MVVLNRIGLLSVMVSSDVIRDWVVIKRALSILVPGYQYSEKYQNGWWDGYIRFYDKRTHVFPLGLLERVEEAMRKNKVEWVRKGFEEQDVSWAKFSTAVTAEQRDYQRDAIVAFLKRRCGIIVVPTRGGKTYIASETIRLLTTRYEQGFNTVFITDSTDLFYQAINDISKILGVSSESIGKIKEKVIQIERVTVAMTQTLQSILKRPLKTQKNYAEKKARFTEVEKYIKSVRFLIVDEIHEYGKAKARIALLGKFHPDYFMTLTATPDKNDEIVSLNILKLTGGVAYVITEDKLIEKKVLAKSRILLLYLESDVEEEGLDYRDMLNKLIIEGEPRNSVIELLVKIAYKLEIKLLVVCSSVKHGNILSERTGVRFIHGGTAIQQRLLEKKRFLSGKGKVLISSWIWKKGITLPEVQIILNVSGGKEQSLVMQIRGRGLGVDEGSGKTSALFIDFLDQCAYLGEHSLQRITTYENKVGKDLIDVLDATEDDFDVQLFDYLTNFFNDDQRRL